MELPEETKIFLVEGHEILDAAESALLLLEKNPRDAQSVHSLFRGLHTIKGNAGFLGFGNLEKLCHRAESILDRARSGSVMVDGALAGALLNSVDAIREVLAEIENAGSDSEERVAASLQELGRWLER